MDPDEIILETESAMEKAFDYLTHEFASVRTGKASPALVENIDVEAYGSAMKLKQLALISTPDPRLIVIQPFDASTTKDVERALKESKLGINPISDGKLIRLPIPPLTEERRRDLVKSTKQMSEESRIRVRSARREGIEGIRKFTGAADKPLLGGIVKPKVGLNSTTLLEVVKQMVEGGVNFIKEDEIMANPSSCPLEERVPLICNYLKGKNVVYCFCINGDADVVLERAKYVAAQGGNGIHVNFWSGLGIYKRLRELDLPLFIHYQKSGITILTDKRNPFHIEWTVICKLAGLCGVDFIHAGMIGGYSDNGKDEMLEVLKVLHKYRVMPALSCGMHPGLVEAIRNEIGIDWMANCGGAIHGHPQGTFAGAKAMRQSIDRTGGAEYESSLTKWALVTKV